MPLYQYIKAVPKQKRVRRRPWALSFFLMGSGAALLLWVIWPILSFIVVSNDQYALALVSPIQDNQMLVSSGLAGTVLAAAEQTDGSVALDTTNADAWFPMKPQKKVILPVTRYRVSIPKLKIENAVTIIGATDLTQSLIHYGGTAVPGDYGTTIVFGHSTLPQLFDQLNYKTIFSTLPTLTRGDEFFVDYDGVRYTYRIYEMTVRDPNDLSELEQKYD